MEANNYRMGVKCLFQLSIALMVCGHISSLSWAESNTCDSSYQDWSLYKAMESALLNDSNQLFRLKGTFFPSSLYQFWKVDGLQAKNFYVSLSLSDQSCRNVTKQSKLSLSSVNRSSWRRYQWTNSFILNLIAIHQLYEFEPLSTSFIHKQSLEHGKNSEVIKLKMNITDSCLCSISQEQLEKTVMTFISWVKAYAKAEGKPETWDEDDQGFVSRKFDRYTKGSQDDGLQLQINNIILVYFICSNCFLLYIILLNARKLYFSIGIMANSPESTSHKQSLYKSVIVVTVYLLVPLYIAALSFWHTDYLYPKYYPPCSTQIIYECVPPYSSSAYQQQVSAFFAKAGILILLILFYFVSATVTVKKVKTVHILFRSRYCRWMEAYILCATLLGIHICVGLAGVPFLVFILITPTYTLFCVCSFALLFILLSLPVTIFFHSCRPTIRVACHISNRRKLSLNFFKILIGYILLTPLAVSLLLLYYCFLVGGASLDGTKGIIFSLIPPAVVSLSVLLVRKSFLHRNKEIESKTDVKEYDRIIV